MTISESEITTDFVSTKALDAGPDAVLAALGTAAGVEGWWGLTAGSPVAGGWFSVGFGSERRIDLRVDTFGPERVVWQVEGAPHTPEWVGTTIAFELAPMDGGTELRFRHHGLTPQLECFDMCHAGWTHYLASLVAYVERGEGDPYRLD